MNMSAFPRLALGLALSIAVTQVAFGHALLVSADPPVNGVAKAPPQKIDLVFSEEISGKLSGATIKGADGKSIAVTTMTEKAGKGLMVMLKQPLPSGTYTVQWHAVASDDGHRTQGTYKFTVN